MGQKVDPRGLRLGITRTWDSIWYSDKKDYAQNFHEDLKIRNFIKDNYYHAGIAKVVLERTSPTQVVIIVYTAKAGILIGRRGSEIEALKAKLEKMTAKKVMIKVQEVKDSSKNAQLVAENIALSIEKRVAFKRAMSQSIGRAMRSGVGGIKIAVSGRLNGAEIARTEWVMEGRVPLHTLRADIDYATATARTTYGAIGIKVWIFNGEVLPGKKEGGKA